MCREQECVLETLFLLQHAAGGFQLVFSASEKVGTEKWLGGFEV